MVASGRCSQRYYRGPGELREACLSSPVVIQWLVRPGGFAYRLRAIRVTAGLTGVELASRLGWTKHKVSKVEHGYQLIAAEEVRAWVKACGAPAKVADELIRLLTESRSIKLRWQDKLSGGQRPVQATYTQLMAASADVAFYETEVVPGPLQVAEYAAGILAWSLERLAAPVQDLDAAVAARLEGGQYLYDRSKRFTFILGEPALRWRYCSAETMLAQLDRLQGVLDLPSVWFGVIPLDVQLAGPPPASFVIYDNLVIVETYGAEHSYQGGQEAQNYRQAVDQLKEAAVTGNAARVLITAAADRLRAAD